MVSAEDGIPQQLPAHKPLFSRMEVNRRPSRYEWRGNQAVMGVRDSGNHGRKSRTENNGKERADEKKWMGTKRERMEEGSRAGLEEERETNGESNSDVPLLYISTLLETEREPGEI